MTFYERTGTGIPARSGFVVEGRVRVQVEGGDCRGLEAGDAVVIAPGERHWHGAVPGSPGTHIAVNVDAAPGWSR